MCLALRFPSCGLGGAPSVAQGIDIDPNGFGLACAMACKVCCAVESRLYVAKQFANAARPESEPAHDSGCHVRHTAISAVKRDLSCIYCVMASREHGTTETDHTTVDGPKEPPPRPHTVYKAVCGLEPLSVFDRRRYVCTAVR